MEWEIKKVRKVSYKYASDAEKEIKRLEKQGFEVYADAPNVALLRRPKGYEPPKPKKSPKKAEPSEGSD